MADPIYNQNAPYCLPADVLSLLGSVNFNSSANQTAFLQSAITSATQRFESMTNRRFTPVRHVERQDGTGTPSMILEHNPVISIQAIKNYINSQMLTVTYNDYQLTIDRHTGIVRVPLTFVTSAAVQFTQAFYKGNRNIEIDYWSGFSREVIAETLTTTDHATYAFANQNLAKTNVEQFGPIQSTPPVYTPVVYKNGVQLVNTTYQWNANFSGNAFSVLQDNIFYTVNWTNGTLTFNTPNQSGDVITADYAYWYIPSDVARGVAKLAAIEVLKTESVGAGGVLGQGASAFDLGEYKVIYGKQNGFAYEGIITTWDADVDEIAERYARRGPDMTGGYFSAGGSYV